MTELALNRLLNQKEVAQLFGLSEAWLEKARWQGEGPPFIKVGKRAVRYEARDVTAYIKANRRTSTTDPGGLSEAGP